MPSSPISIIASIIQFPYLLGIAQPPSMTQMDFSFKFGFQWRPSWKILYFFSLVVYFIGTSGFVYNTINKPPLYGMQRENNKLVTQTVLPYRINAQYVSEGIYAGLMYCLGGLGIVAITHSFSAKAPKSQTGRNILLYGGSFVSLVSYLGLLAFLKIKVPYYMVVNQH